MYIRFEEHNSTPTAARPGVWGNASKRCYLSIGMYLLSNPYPRPGAELDGV